MKPFEPKSRAPSVSSTTKHKFLADTYATPPPLPGPMPQMNVSAPVWAKVHELRQKYVQHRVRQRSNNRHRSLGTVKLHSSSYQCPWVSEEKIGHVMHGGVVISDGGDSYSS